MTAIIDRPSGKFTNTLVTADGSARAHVPFKGFETLWFNTGTLCNLACHNCYIESSPRNDALVYLSRAEVADYLAEAGGLSHRPVEIGFTGGEPFMNPDMIGMAEDALAAGYRVLILTNAMKPMHHVKASLLDLHIRFPKKLALRISLDGYTSEAHEELRGPRSWEPTLAGLTWACAQGFDVAVAGRTVWGESEAQSRAGFAKLFAALGLALDAADPARLVLFPEMEADRDVAEITEQCWGILDKTPDSVMCSNSRMVVKPKGAARPHVASCTLLPYAPDFAMGDTLAASMRDVSLNHPFCAQFCVLGGASCSAGS
mgnify:CR=1 FL=1|tara:strand:+ start:345939 stop:346886 length:948 start_codon:yes stop_codon:yes gene_type:complete